MRIVVPTEVVPGERRVAIVPDVVPLYTGVGLRVTVQSRACEHAFATDEAFSAAGAEVVDAVEAASVDVLLHVRPLNPATVRKLHPGAITVGFCSPSTKLDTVRALRDRGITSFAMELVPRTARAQPMDALASQALVAGYRCVLEAATRLPRFLPPFMTAAGTVPPTKVLVLGTGVAGLQAIATAKRLGALVSAHDVRAASAQEVASLGGRFLDLDTVERTGDYAEEHTGKRAARWQELLAPHVADCDVLITTAAAPERPAPRLVTAATARTMRPGSVIVDLAAETGGNVEGSRAGEDLPIPVRGGTVRLLGLKDAASGLPVDASRLYARNVANLLLPMARDGEIVLDLDDEVLAAACLTHDGLVRHEPTAARLRGRPGDRAGDRSGDRIKEEIR